MRVHESRFSSFSLPLFFESILQLPLEINQEKFFSSVQVFLAEEDDLAIFFGSLSRN